MGRWRGEMGAEWRGAHLQAARGARRGQTPAERAMWEMVRDHRCGVHFRRQSVRRPFRLDFYCPSLRFAIEVDGGIHEEPSVQRRDAERQEILEHDRRIRFFRVTNEDVLQRPTATRQSLLAALRQLQAAQAPDADAQASDAQPPTTPGPDPNAPAPQ